MSPQLKSIGAITLFVEELERSKTFYRDVFALPVHFEDQNSVVFKFDNLLINLLQVRAAHGLIGPAAVAGPQGGSRFQFTIWVDDTDAICSELGKRGVELLNGPLDRAWGMRTASFQDPDGHIWEIAQVLSQV
jgi:catechol 2,3-dioxygenase-like lactoylglutathione lyase family enzyme